MDTIVMTGAAGRIGTLLRHHWASTYRIVGIDIRPLTPFSQLEEFIHGPIQGPKIGNAFHLAGKSPLVVHLAAATSGDAPWEEYLSANIDGTARVLQEAVSAHARRVVLASTNHVTGALEKQLTDRYPDGVPLAKHISPDVPARPDGLYAVSKACGETLSRYYAECHKLPVICLRIGSVTDKDDPWETARLRATWLSHRDCCRLFDCCLRATVGFGIYYACSNNRLRFWDLSTTSRDLGFVPHDSADTGPIIRMERRMHELSHESSPVD